MTPLVSRRSRPRIELAHLGCTAPLPSSPRGAIARSAAACIARSLGRVHRSLARPRVHRSLARSRAWLAHSAASAWLARRRAGPIVAAGGRWRARSPTRRGLLAMSCRARRHPRFNHSSELPFRGLADEARSSRHDVSCKEASSSSTAQRNCHSAASPTRGGGARTAAGHCGGGGGDARARRRRRRRRRRGGGVRGAAKVRRRSCACVARPRARRWKEARCGAARCDLTRSARAAAEGHVSAISDARPDRAFLTIMSLRTSWPRCVLAFVSFVRSPPAGGRASCGGGAGDATRQWVWFA